MPILEAVEGRFEDICFTPDGRAMLRFDTVFKGVETIREAQVVQEAMDSFTIYVVPADGFNTHDIDSIEENMQSHVGNVQIEVKPVAMIHALTQVNSKQLFEISLPRIIARFRQTRTTDKIELS